ncbi:MAG: hypothetical protein AAB817_03085 [Patescibacteria group bacterium]
MVQLHLAELRPKRRYVMATLFTIRKPPRAKSRAVIHRPTRAVRPKKGGGYRRHAKHKTRNYRFDDRGSSLFI